MEIRNLRADEINCRTQTVKENGCALLLYKDARVDMNILDETFGIMGWKRSHQLIGDNVYCTIEVWDKEKQQWIPKQDVGIESNTEAEKGQASDSFKRAGFNVGIGRELYTTPFIWIKLQAGETYSSGGKYKLNSSLSFRVDKIECENKNIVELHIVDNKNTSRFYYKKTNKNTNIPTNNLITREQQKYLFKIISSENEKNKLKEILKEKGISSTAEIQKNEYKEILSKLQTPEFKETEVIIA